MSYRSEAFIGAQLSAAGHPVSDWTTVEIDHEFCCIGIRLSGRPITYVDRWTGRFAAELDSILHDLHHLSARGFGARGRRGRTTRLLIDRHGGDR